MPFVSLAQSTFYVRSNAAGSRDGSDWNKAFHTLPSALQRGATYYLSDGTYSAYGFDDAESGTTKTVIKKATIDDHGSEIGWQDSYGDGQAVFSGFISFGSGYWVIDGNTPIGTYGFRVLGNASSTSYLVGMGTSSSQREDITIRGLEIDGSALSGNYNGFNRGGPTYATHFYNCRAYKVPGDPFALHKVNNMILEHCVIDERGDSQGTHADAIVFSNMGNDNVVRYNVIRWNGQQIFFDGTAPSHGTVDVYGNVFDGHTGTASKGIHVHNTIAPSIAQLRVFNNTFVRFLVNSAMTLKGSTSGDVRNNLFYDVVGVQFGGTTHDYNWFPTHLGTFGESHGLVGANPFVDYSAGNFTLTVDLAGQVLSPPFDGDMSGRERGADGVWDRGAFERDGNSREGVPGLEVIESSVL